MFFVQVKKSKFLEKLSFFIKLTDDTQKEHQKPVFNY